MKYPLVSIIILNWNGKKWLKKCLPSLRRVAYPHKEIIVVNNGSTDDSAAYIAKNYPEVVVLTLTKNIGYAAANNTGVRSAKGKYVLFINNDTEFTPSFLGHLVDDLETDPQVGAVQPQMRSMIHPDLLDSAGSFFTDTGFLYYLGYMKSYRKKLYQKIQYVYSVKGACFIMRRKEFWYLGGFDEDFVCYVEETDLCHRIWLSGKKVLYDPRGVMYHWGGGDMQVQTQNETNIYRSFRNRFFSYYKNFSIGVLLWLLPVHLVIAELYALVSFCTGRLRSAIAIQKGIISGVFDLGSMSAKRRHIQRSIRVVGDGEVLKYVRKNPRPVYYYSLLAGNQYYED